MYNLTFVNDGGEDTVVSSTKSQTQTFALQSNLVKEFNHISETPYKNTIDFNSNASPDSCSTKGYERLKRAIIYGYDDITGKSATEFQVKKQPKLPKIESEYRYRDLFTQNM